MLVGSLMNRPVCLVAQVIASIDKPNETVLHSERKMMEFSVIFQTMNLLARECVNIESPAIIHSLS